MALWHSNQPNLWPTCTQHANSLILTKSVPIEAINGRVCHWIWDCVSEEANKRRREKKNVRGPNKSQRLNEKMLNWEKREMTEEKKMGKMMIISVFFYCRVVVDNWGECIYHTLAHGIMSSLIIHSDTFGRFGWNAIAWALRIRCVSLGPSVSVVWSSTNAFDSIDGSRALFEPQWGDGGMECDIYKGNGKLMWQAQ